MPYDPYEKPTPSPQETINGITEASVRFAKALKDAGIDPGPGLAEIIESCRMVLLSNAKRDRRESRRRS